MKTSEALFKQFGKKFVPAKIINDEYFGYTYKYFREQALKGSVGGIRFFQVRNDGPMFADIDQIAEAIDQKARAK